MADEKTLTPKEFIEKLLEKQRSKSLSNFKEDEEFDRIRDEELKLIDKIYSHIVDETLIFCDKNAPLRNETEVIISISFSIFASICTKILEDELIDKKQFLDMIKSNLNKLFEENNTNFQVVSKK